MARAKKITTCINYKLESVVVEKFRHYAEAKGQSYTTALERIINGYIECKDYIDEKIENVTMKNEKDMLVDIRSKLGN